MTADGLDLTLKPDETYKFRALLALVGLVVHSKQITPLLSSTNYNPKALSYCVTVVVLCGCLGHSQTTRRRHPPQGLSTIQEKLDM
jgi:hypothetical protein